MGTGKTEVGRKLAEKLKMNFVDMDDLIESEEGMKISEIFARFGESYFRRIEKEIAKRVSKLNNHVIATGGGVVLDEENLNNFRKNGILICLTATPEAIFERTSKSTHRPLLNEANPMEKIKKLLQYRAPFYAKAQYSVDTTDLSIQEVADRIIGILKLSNPS
jgi:shikimate kinase